MVRSILPCRNEFIQLLLTIARYDSKGEFIEYLHKFFESLIPYMLRSEGVTNLGVEF